MDQWIIFTWVILFPCNFLHGQRLIIADQKECPTSTFLSEIRKFVLQQQGTVRKEIEANVFEQLENLRTNLNGSVQQQAILWKELNASILEQENFRKELKESIEQQLDGFRLQLKATLNDADSLSKDSNVIKDECRRGWTNHGKNCYFIETQNKLNWDAASKECVEWNSRLTVPRNALENEFVKGLSRATGEQNIWLGISDNATEGRWVDSMRMPLGFTDWAPGEPNDALGEDCGMFGRRFGYMWNDIPCNHVLAYICEYNL